MASYLKRIWRAGAPPPRADTPPPHTHTPANTPTHPHTQTHLATARRIEGCDDVIGVLLSGEGAKAVVRAMAEHPDEQPVQEQVCLSVCLSVYLSVSVCLYTCTCIYVSVCVCLLSVCGTDEEPAQESRAAGYSYKWSMRPACPPARRSGGGKPRTRHTHAPTHS